MDVEELLQSLALDRDARFALLQLCSTAYLAAGRLDEEACRRLLAPGLVTRAGDGFWRPTKAGRRLFDQLESAAGGA